MPFRAGMRSGFVLAGVLAVGLAAALHAVLRDGDAARSPPAEAEPVLLEGAGVPAPGVLGGSLIARVEDGCIEVDLGSLSVLDTPPASGCEDPHGAVASPRLAPYGVVLPDGRRLDETDLARGLRSNTAEPVRAVGAAVRADGLVAVAVVRQAGELLRSLYRGPPGPGLLQGESFNAAVALSHGGGLPELVLELWDGPSLLESIPLPTVGYPVFERPLGEMVHFAPRGEEVAVASGGADGRLALVDLRSRTVVLGPVSQHAFAWSPDAAWLAVAGADGIAVHGLTRSEAAFALPLEASSLAWR